MNKTKLLTLASSLLLIGGALVSCAGEAISSETPKGKSYVNETNADLNLSVGAKYTTFKGESASERQKILGLLEKYAYENNLTGISLFEDGGYQVFSDTVQLPTENYVTGYGFGTLRYGSITSDLAGESKAEWKRYYHSYLSEDPANLNYMDDKGSVVGNLIGYGSSSYFGQALNANKDGYIWEGDLSNDDRPTALDEDYATTGTSKKFKFSVKIGSELKYNTLTANSTLAKYKDREVAIDDYLTPYLLLWTKAVGYARSAENLTSSTGIAGANEYYNSSASGIDLESFKKKVGIDAYVGEDGKGYIEIELNEAATPFMAMYYISSAMYAPVPLDFIKDLGNGDALEGAKVWGKFTDGGLTPADTTLSTGAYVLEAWEKDKQIVYKKNDNYYAKSGEYNIAGVHMNILAAAKTDTEAGIKEFEANKLSACGIPQTQLAKYKTDPRTKVYDGSSVFKLNVNSCDQETWNSLFGVNGSVTQTALSDYWECEPIMSNDDFLLGLSYSLNRTEFADKRGCVPSVNYFSSAYLVDPENAVSYNSTADHKAAVASRTANGTLSDGYSLTLGQDYFTNAAKAMVEAGTYKSGDTITVEVAWMYQQNISNYGTDIEKYWEDAFNSSDANKVYGLTLDVENMSVATWSDVYYKKMMVGQYDIAFGSISGNAYDPLNFMEVLKSDNSSGFTLNWGTDTSLPGIEYNGKTYSYDALWQAADTSCYIDSEGKIADGNAFFAAGVYESLHNNESGERTVVIKTASEKDHDINITGVTFSSFYAIPEGKISYKVDEYGNISFTLPEAYESALDSLDVTIHYTYTYQVLVDYDDDDNPIYDDVTESYTKDVTVKIAA